MGDVLSLIERAESALDDESRARLEQKTRLDDFTLEDFRDQLRTIRKMGPLEQVLGMIPGLPAKDLEAQKGQVDERQLGHVEAIIGSMTPGERRNPRLINGSRRKRIARGSGRSVEEVNRLLKQFVEMKRVLQMIGQGQMPGMKGMGSGGNRAVQQAQQAMRQGGHGLPMPGKKRKKGGPWGLIKAR
jgi:signal recognition particle subunit SRP54